MSTKLKCLLLDDELPGLTYLKMLCEQLPELEVVKAFNNPELFLQECSRYEFDLCILDIEMPGIDGLSVARELKDVPVIFTTAYTEYAIDAFDVHAVDYLRKPVKLDRLKIAVQKVAERMRTDVPEKKFLLLNTDKGKARIYIDQLAYICTSETDSRDKTAFMQDGNSVTLKNISFEKLLGLLPAELFCRINKKEVLALSVVQFFAHDNITVNIPLADKQQIFTLTEAYKEDFIRKIRI